MRSDETVTTTYFIAVPVEQERQGVNLTHIVPAIAETDTRGMEKGIFVWLINNRHEDIVLNDSSFRDSLYNQICTSIFGFGMERFWDLGGKVIKMPSGSVWSQHCDIGRAFQMNQHTTPPTGEM